MHLIFYKVIISRVVGFVKIYTYRQSFVGVRGSIYRIAMLYITPACALLVKTQTCILLRYISLFSHIIRLFVCYIHVYDVRVYDICIFIV